MQKKKKKNLATLYVFPNMVCVLYCEYRNTLSWCIFQAAISTPSCPLNGTDCLEHSEPRVGRCIHFLHSGPPQTGH